MKIIFNSRKYLSNKKYNIFILTKNNKNILFSKLLIFIFFIILLNNNINYKNYKSNKLLYSERWIVMNAYNQPSLSILDLLNNLNSWKIVIIGNIKTIDKKWKLLSNTNNIIYLSLREQMKLGYKTSKYLNINSYARKNIGYLFAIQHGAKEIYEIDEDLIIPNLKNIKNNIKFNNTKICFGLNKHLLMINPYSHFGQKSLWPRGFKLKDIGKEYYNKFYVINSSQFTLKPLIFQGLINGIPDVDTIFLQTRIHTNNIINYTFSDNYPLLYLPGNYIPINSKNTKYLYDIFPFITLPTTINEKLSDILRGYILQRFSWEYNGAVIYYSSNISRNKSIYLNYSKFIEEKNLFYKLDNFFNILNKKFNSKNSNPKKLLIYLIKNLIKEGFLKKYDLNIYKAFLEDLSNFGYIYSTLLTKEIKYNYYNYKKLLKKYSKYILYLQSNEKYIIKQKNRNKNIIMLLNHYFINKK